MLVRCGEHVSDSKYSKSELLEKVFENLLKHKKVNLKILHSYINICTKNNIKLNTTEFFQNTKFQGTTETYKILLKNVCEKGDIGEALKILTIMKTQSVSLDEFVFNNLILAHSMSG